MRASVRVFARVGVEGASIEAIAREAGYSRGAFYTNFKDKEALCLVVLERGFEEYLERFIRIPAGSDEPEAGARRAGEDLGRLARADPEWQRLHLELHFYALRNKRFRRRLIARHQALREHVTEVFAARARDLGIESPVPLDQLTKMTFTMSMGFALEKTLEPDLMPDELYGTMLSIFFGGLRNLVEDARDTGAAAQG